MISVVDLVKEFPTHTGNVRVLDNISFTIRKGERIALLGTNGSGKTTLISLIGGIQLPTSGRIDRSMSISWPIGFSSVFQGSLTGMDNLRFISRIYAVPFEGLRDQVEEFSELGKYMYEPVKTYSTGMSSRLSFGISIAIDFDCYLIDEVIAAGDHRFREKCEELLFARKRDKSFIIATHVSELAKKYCDKSLVLRKGRGKVFDDIDVGLEVYQSL